MANTGNGAQGEVSYAMHHPEASLPTCDGCGHPVAPSEAHWIYTTDHARCVPEQSIYE